MVSAGVVERHMDQYYKVCNRNTELFSSQDPDTLFNSLIDAAEKQAINCQVHESQYKAKMMVDLPDGSKLKITAKFLKVDDQEVCIEF
jgi:hypothetical protein